MTSAAYERTGSHLATQASAFSETCNVYAPYYRQATYFSFFDTKSKNGFNALDLAYSDLSNAFEVFMEKHNNGKPFFHMKDDKCFRIHAKFFKIFIGNI